MTFRSPKLLRMARDQSCVMCGADDQTIVAAHSNFAEHEKGAHHKAHDAMTAHLCFRCHTELDQGKSMGREEKLVFILTAICRTLMRLFDQGKVIVK